MIAEGGPPDYRVDIDPIGIMERTGTVVQNESEAVVTGAVGARAVKTSGRIDQTLYWKKRQFPLQEFRETEPDRPGGNQGQECIFGEYVS